MIEYWLRAIISKWRCRFVKYGKLLHSYYSLWFYSHNVHAPFLCLLYVEDHLLMWVVPNIEININFGLKILKFLYSFKSKFRFYIFL
jgi:hypothetical protein